MLKVNVPLTVPKAKALTYTKNYRLATKNTGRLFLFAGDQKVEHLNGDFFGKDISPEDNDPEHLFKIADKSPVGVFAAQLGLIASYGKKYKKIPYLIKINSKTNLDKADEPVSKELINVQDVIDFKKNSRLNILGVGYTVYIGGEHESEILQEASRVILDAHKNGLIAVLWMYPRGKDVKNEDDIHLIAGGAGVALCLGADFVKVKYPYTGKKETAQEFKEVVAAAGNTKVVCAGGSRLTQTELLKNIYYQINVAKTAGSAIGRNLHQYPLKQAISLAKAVAAICLRNKTLKEATALLKSAKR